MFHAIYNSFSSFLKSRIRFSIFHTLILRIRNPEYIRHLNAEYLFYKSFIGTKRNLVFDIGANKGDKSLIFNKLNKKVVAFEPDMASFAILKKRFRWKFNVILENCAISSKNGTSDFFVEKPGSALNTLSTKWKNTLENQDKSRFSDSHSFSKITSVVTYTLDSMIEKHGIPEFIKIDVEGFELEVIKGLTNPPNKLSFECNLPEFFNEALDILMLLKQMNNKYFCNYIWDTHEGFKIDWVDINTFIELFKSYPHRYMEIFIATNAGE